MTNLSDTLAALSEPVAWLIDDGETSWVTQFKPKAKDHPYSEISPLYRTGQLVPVPSVEAVARAIVRTNTEQRVRRDPRLTDEERHDIVECQVYNGWDLWVPEATAVIAAMQEKPE